MTIKEMIAVHKTLDDYKFSSVVPLNMNCGLFSET